MTISPLGSQALRLDLQPGFWESAGAAYDIFCSLCYPGDWERILFRTAEHIAALGGAGQGPLSVADIGAGTGQTAQFIRRALLGRHGIRSTWSYVEPDPALNRHHRDLVIDGSDLGLAAAETSIDGLTDHYDVITFIHSSYYIGPIGPALGRALARLKPGGHLVFLSMPKNSDFFLGCPELIYDNTSTQIRQHIAVRQDLDIAVVEPLQSRFRVESEQIAELTDVMYGFLTNFRITKDAFGTLIECKANQWLDCSDELLITRKNRHQK